MGWVWEVLSSVVGVVSSSSADEHKGLESLRGVCANDDALKIALGSAVGRPGERSQLYRAKEKLRNEALRDCAKNFYSTHRAVDYRHEFYSVTSSLDFQAMMISKDLRTYFTDVWPRYKGSEVCPDRHLGKADFYFWTALRLIPRAIGPDQIETILMETS